MAFIPLTLLHSTLSLAQDEDQAAEIFSTVFVVVWLGSFFVTMNAALLGGKM